MSTTSHRHVTLAEVAERADVSLSTASRALNGVGSRPVHEDLRARAFLAAAQLGYIPNAHAQALAGGTANTVGLVTHDVSDPYFASISRGAMRVAMEHQALVVLASTFRDPERELAHVSSLRAQRARAILLLGSGFEDKHYTRTMREELRAYEATGGRVAMVSHHNFIFDAVKPDNRGGAAALGHALCDMGHRHIAVVSGPRRLTTVGHRVDGFLGSLAEHGLEVPPSLMIETEFNQKGGYVATQELIDKGMSCTALFCTNDVMAIGALQALKERGVHVPDDLSVAGFDDIPIVRQLTPALSTVALPLEQMGEAVMSLALDGVKRTRRRTQRVAATVVLRESTAPPARIAAPHSLAKGGR